MKGRFPVCCLFLEIDPAAVDVNIHPAKREVKFHQEKTVRHLVTQAIRQTLLAFHTTSTPAAEPSKKPVEPPKPAEFPQFTPLTGTALDRAPTQKPTPVVAPARPPPIEIPESL